MSFQNNIRALYVNFIGNRGASISAHTYDTFPDSDDISLTAHATANCFGDYVEVISDTGADVWTCGLYLSNANAETDYKVEFATGASASETPRAVVPYQTGAIATTSEGSLTQYYALPFPIHQPDNTRQAARVETGSSAADTIDIVEVHALGLS